MKKIFLFNIFVFFFITLLFSLGTWQLYRLQWKQDLISQIDRGLKSTPIKYTKTVNNNYQRVFLEGQYNFENQIYLYSLNKKGQPGFDVITPFQTLDSENILINRGWINKEMKNKAEINLVNKNLTQGLLRKIVKKNEIQEITGKNFSNFVLFLEDKTINLPTPKKITIDVPNNHLKYAITWYSISISIFFYFLYFRKYQ